MRSVILAAFGLYAVQAAGLPRACREGDNYTAISGCTPLFNDTVITDVTVAPGEYKNFHWAVSNYLDLDDASGNRRTITFEVVPCTGSAHLFVRSLTQPFPTAESHDFASIKNEEPNSVTLQLLRAHFFVSVQGVAPANLASVDPSLRTASDEPVRFSIIAKISGGELAAKRAARDIPRPGAPRPRSIGFGRFCSTQALDTPCPALTARSRSRTSSPRVCSLPVTLWRCSCPSCRCQRRR